MQIGDYAFWAYDDPAVPYLGGEIVEISRPQVSGPTRIAAKGYSGLRFVPLFTLSHEVGRALLDDLQVTKEAARLRRAKVSEEHRERAEAFIAQAQRDDGLRGV